MLGHSDLLWPNTTERLFECQGRPADIAGREVRVAEFLRLWVGWNPYGDVLYVIVAEDARRLEAAVERLQRAVPVA